jgi:amidase
MDRPHPTDTPRPESFAPHDLTRRDLVALLGVSAATLALAGCESPVPDGGTPDAGAVEPSPRALDDPIVYSSAAALAAAIREGRLSSAEVVDAYLARIEDVNPALNAVVQLRADAARADARRADEALAAGETVGPLHGVPMTIKDSLDTSDLITTGGTQGRESFTPDEDATVVRRLREAGAILLGKTNTPELTLSFETDNHVYGRTNNPWDVERTSGGSSGGAAAIVAAGGAAFDIGSDYGGSIRLPAHYNGIAGIKPTFGRVPRTGHIYPFGGVQDTFQQIGPLVRYVEDLVLLFPIIAGPDHVDPAIVPMPWDDPHRVDLSGLRVGFHTDNGIRTPTAETQAAVRSAASVLVEGGAVVDESRPDGVEDTMTVGLPLYVWDGGAAVARMLEVAGTTRPWLERNPESLSAVELDRALADVFDLRSRMAAYWREHDVILCPVNANPAIPHGATDLPDYSYTFTYNVTGWPGAVVRCGTSPEGLPIGVQIVAPPAREGVALAVAARLEQALGGYSRPLL